MATRGRRATKNGLGTRVSTDRLVLRPASEDHVGTISRALAKNARHLATVGPDVPSASLVAVAARVAAERAAFRRGTAFAFYAFPRESGGAPSAPVLAKVVVSGLVPDGPRVGQLGYWVDVGEEGKGLAREAVLAVVRFAFECAEVHALEAVITPSNTRSLRLAERCGFAPTSEVRHHGPPGREVPHRVLSLSAEDWLFSR